MTPDPEYKGFCQEHYRNAEAIATLKSEVDALDARVTEVHADSLRWRDTHSQQNAETFKRLGDGLDSISADLSKRWPTAATVLITVLGTMLGIAVGIAAASFAYAGELRVLVTNIERLIK